MASRVGRGTRELCRFFSPYQRRSLEVRKGFQKRLIEKLHASTQEGHGPTSHQGHGEPLGWLVPNKSPFSPRRWASLSHTPIWSSSLHSKTTLVRQENSSHRLLALRVSAHTLRTPPAVTPATATCWDALWVGPRPSGLSQPGVISRQETSRSQRAPDHSSPFSPLHPKGVAGRDDSGGSRTEFLKVIGLDGSFHLSGKVRLPGGIGDKDLRPG